jgi:conjugal transfer/entry exclusion protein
MVNENNYPQKIKNLIDELKYSKDKMRELDEELRRERKSSITI